ncbi:MAG: single-stranded-DNA-specific exonuclease RecJ, partial [Christensenellales bacterium]
MLRFKPVFQEVDEEKAQSIARRCTLSLEVARIMAGRGMDEETAQAFLQCGRESLHDPFSLSGMDAAADRIRAAIAQKQKIVVYGDYDVDGVTATVIVVSALKDMGAYVDYYLPSRQGEGYGLNCMALDALRAEGAELIITVDCGITALQEAQHARSIGLDLIITDHHQPLTQLPDCSAVVSPLLDGYPSPHICGAGVAAKLVQALLGLEGLEDYFDLVALGTVADVVPLTGENRAFVRLGLEKMNRAPRLALRLLLEEAGFSGQEISAQTLAYVVAPRINAAGRLGDAGLAVDMLIARQKPPYIRELEQMNRKRQDVELEILEQAEEMLQTYDWKNNRAIVLCSEHWHQGVVGIVASRLLERYYRPVVMLCLNGEVCTGSLRSIPDVNIFKILKSMDHLFQRFGGHSAAAGLTMDYSQLAEFCSGLNAQLQEMAPEAFIPCITYDTTLRIQDIN